MYDAWNIVGPNQQNEKIGSYSSSSQNSSTVSYDYLQPGFITKASIYFRLSCLFYYIVRYLKTGTMSVLCPQQSALSHAQSRYSTYIS